MVRNSIHKERSLLNGIEWLCFGIIALNLLWAFFADSVLTRLFSVACIGLCGVALWKTWGNAEQRITGATVGVFISLIVWILVMIPAYNNFSSVLTQLQFLFITGNAHAVFCMRLLVTVLPCIAFSNRNIIKTGIWFRVLLFVVLIVSAIYTAQAVAVNPNALRARESMEHADLGYVIKNTPGYAMTYSYALLTPWFTHKCYTTEGKLKAFYIMCIIFLMYIIVVAQFATALIIAIIGIFAYLLMASSNRTRMLVVFVGIAVFCVITMLDGGADIFYWLADHVQGAWADKLNDIAEVLTRQESAGSVSGRTDLYSDSFTAFTQSPIIGKFWRATDDIGGHATALDVLGMTGILGFIPFAVSVYSNYVRLKTLSTHKETRAIAVVSAVQFVILIFTKNIITSMAIFFVFYAFIPLLIRSEDKEMGEKEDGSDKNNSVQRRYSYARRYSGRA